MMVLTRILRLHLLSKAKLSRISGGFTFLLLTPFFQEVGGQGKIPLDESAGGFDGIGRSRLERIPSGPSMSWTLPPRITPYLSRIFFGIRI
jgi:hypothetical protein